ncbi:class II fumarate hydratase [bacterium]|nr:class II fumarate hydratase [candidate division CSSED10-310 bacterium]
MKRERWRTERDSMGEIRIPEGSLWGAQTQRAIGNFPVSGIRFPEIFINSLAWIKRSCARANLDLKILPPGIGNAMIGACDEIIEGKWTEQFPVDIFQTGSGTSTNMNVNEVIANRSNQLLDVTPGNPNAVHPNDHVNACQSSNDVIPTALHVAAVREIESGLIPALHRLFGVLMEKAVEFDDVIKTGRTHLQDATPVRLGQEFEGYASQIGRATGRLQQTADALREVPLGGTAVGSGLNREFMFPVLALNYLNRSIGERFYETRNHFEGNASREACLEASGALRSAAAGLARVSGDIRWMGSGPHNGLGELILPPVQPGSSIMPGKINPVIPESVLMVEAQIQGNDASIAAGVRASRFELNTMMPLIAHNLLQSIRILAAAAHILTDRCIRGIKANRKHCAETFERNLSLAAALAPEIGYDRAADIAGYAWKTGRTVRDIVLERNILPRDRVTRILDPRRLTLPGFPDRD